MPKARTIRNRYDYRTTWVGVLYMVGMSLIALAAINNQRGLLLVIFGLMVGAFFSSVLISRRMLSCLDVSRNLPDRAFACQVVHLAYSLRHKRPKRPGVVGIEINEVQPPKELQAVSGYCLFLPGGGSFTSGARLVFQRRGRYRLAGLRLMTRFPFWLMRALRIFAQEAELIVWPALGRLKVNLLIGGAAEVSDAAPSQVHSGADEFFGLREYRQGDNPRWIHWKRSAGRRMPVVREMSKPRPDELLVVLDTQLAPGQSPDVLEPLISFAATLCDNAIHREFQVGLALAYADGPKCFPAQGGRGQRVAVLDALAMIDENRKHDLSAALGAMGRRDFTSTHVVLITPNGSRLAALGLLRRFCRRLTVITPDNVGRYFEEIATGSEAGALDAPTGMEAQPRAAVPHGNAQSGATVPQNSAEGR